MYTMYRYIWVKLEVMIETECMPCRACGRVVQLTVRVMNYYQFMNSKVLFKEVRHKPAGSTAMPVMVHISKCDTTALLKSPAQLGTALLAKGCCFLWAFAL
jgi:hypothetical protein